MKKLLSIFFFPAVLACHKDHGGYSTRTYRMGFQSSAPRADINLALQSLDLWTKRADAAIINTEVPWDSLLNGQDPVTYVVNNYKALADFYRSKKFKLWVYIDPANGLNRATDADLLVARGKSIAQAGMQQLYRKFVVAMDSVLSPEHLGLALETNLIRGMSPDSIYQGVRQSANAAAQDVRSFDKSVWLSVSVQVDHAWGMPSGPYQGVAKDFADFPFIQELGLSSYPYFSSSSPADLPSDYYSRLVEGKSMPVFVSEGGWTSQSISGVVNSSPALQQDYIRRQEELLDHAHAIALFQLTFTDIDLSSLPPSTPPVIKYFAYIGLADANIQPKPALAAWDLMFKRPLQ